MADTEDEKKKRFDELYRRFKYEENDLCNTIGIGLDSFKGNDWKNHRFYIDPSSSIRMFQQLLQNFSIYMCETLCNDGPGLYDFMICLRKNEGDIQKHISDFQDMDKKRKEMVEECKKKIQALEDEFYEKSQPIPEAKDAHKDESV